MDYASLVGQVVIVRVPKDLEPTEVLVLEHIPGEWDDLRVKRTDTGFEFIVEAFRAEVKS